MADSGASPAIAPRRIARNFAAMSCAEVVCRATSVGVTLYLARSLGTTGFGRIEFAFNIVCWLVLLVREGLDVLAAREIARHPKLVRPLVNQVLAIRGLLALGLFSGLVLAGALTLSEPGERLILTLYGLMLATTAMGLDFVFRGLERMGLVAVSLVLRTSAYAGGVALFVTRPEHVAWVPACLVAGEAMGITLVWWAYSRQFGLPRPSLHGCRALNVMLKRGRPVYLIQVSQAVIGSIDLLVVGLLSRWGDVGLYSAPHRMVTAVLTFGLIFQQVVFPTLARSWRDTPEAGRRALDTLVRVLMLGLVPIAVGTIVLAGPLVRGLFQTSYAGATPLLAVGILRAPLLILAFLYQTALIALNREASSVRTLVVGAVLAGPLVALFRLTLGLPGASLASVLIAGSLAVAGYRRLSQAGRAPAWHHHIGRPLAASAVMGVVVALVARTNLALAVACGAATYFGCLLVFGGLDHAEIRELIAGGRRRAANLPRPHAMRPAKGSESPRRVA